MRSTQTNLSAACAALLAGAAATSAPAQTGTWAFPEGSFDPSGSGFAPYATLRAAACAAEATPERVVLLGTGAYHEALTLDGPLTLRAQGGPATIGTGAADATSFTVETYNTHLFGEIPSLLEDIMIFFGLLEHPLTWQDDQRASRIGALFTGAGHDVVGLQEVWNDGLWQVIRNASGQPRSFYGDQKGQGVSIPVFGAIPDQLHSGLGILSPLPIAASQYIYARETGIPEALSAKSYIAAHVVKGSFAVGIFMTHLQAGSEFDSDVRGARASQLLELRQAVLSFRLANPDSPVIIMGDLNIRGSGDPTSEYQQNLLTMFDLEGFIDAAREDFCNRPRNGVTSSRDNDLNRYFDPQTSDARLDYVLYAPSADGRVRLILREVETLDHMGPTALSEKGLVTRRLSDHYGVRAKFDLIRR
ncbi:MAG: endonuclease/exonuclease/phosphatase family protein [Phycisphaerales bacterium JB039]